MYTTQTCPFCHRAKALLGQRGVMQIDEVRIDTEPGQFGHLHRSVGWIEDHDLAEGTRVDEAQLLAEGILEMEHDMGVRNARGVRAVDEDPTAHPQVDHQRLTGVERQDQVLAPPLRAECCGTGQPVDQRLARGAPNRAFAADLDALDAPADEALVQAATNRFDFRELGHAADSDRRIEAGGTRERQARLRRGCLLGELLRAALALTVDLTGDQRGGLVSLLAA